MMLHRHFEQADEPKKPEQPDNKSGTIAEGADIVDTAPQETKADKPKRTTRKKSEAK